MTPQLQDALAQKLGFYMSLKYAEEIDEHAPPAIVTILAFIVMAVGLTFVFDNIAGVIYPEAVALQHLIQ